MTYCIIERKEHVMHLRDGERLDDLLAEGYKIIQSSGVFSFSLDAVLLARFCHVPIKRGVIIDLCSGNAVIPLLLSTRSQSRIIGVELQPELVDMASRSVNYNNLTEQIVIKELDLRESPKALGYGKADMVTVNPPYFPLKPDSLLNVNHHVALARHEVGCTLRDVVTAASQLVKPGGRVAMVHRPERLAEIFAEFKTKNLEPKRLQFSHSKKGNKANMVLVEGRKNGQPGLTTEPPIFVYEENGAYTPHVRALLYGANEKRED